MPPMETSAPTCFADLLRRYRRRCHLTQEELAERAGISPAAVSLLERGLTQAPQRATVQLLGEALVLDADEATAFAETARRSSHLAHDLREGAGPVASEVATGATPEAAPVFMPGERLPVPLTSLVGRERDEVALLELLAAQPTRLLTLTGPAGVGKTRLALQLATRLRRESRQDVVFVGLLSVLEPERVLPVIAQALGMRESGMLLLRDVLVRGLQDRPLVLVLDNFEQVLPAARDILDLLVACPQVKALVTSRSTLNVRGERCYPVAPLALPDPTDLDSIEQVSRAPTVALFLERASAAQPDFRLSTLAEMRLVADICTRLDGLPLAIELAAARVRHFGLQSLHERLAQPTFLAVLTEGPQDLASHQRTMRSTIAWSYEQLGEQERRLFRWLGVFTGGVSDEAAVAVCGLSDEALMGSLGALVDANLLQCGEGGGASRYTQLVTLRAYAQEQLRAEGEWGEARRRHADYFLTLTELIAPHALDQHANVLSRVEAEYENVYAALAWAWETDATMHGLRMAGVLWRYWFTYSPTPAEGLDWLERFIARFIARTAIRPSSPEEQLVLAQALMGVVAISHRLDRFEHAREVAERLVAVRRELGDKAQIAYALNALANPTGQLGDRERAIALYEEAIALHREANNQPGMIVALQNLAWAHYELGQPRAALEYIEQGIELSCASGASDLARAAMWIDVADFYLALDDPVRAIELATPNHWLLMRERDTFGTAAAAFTLGRAAWRLGDAPAASAHLDEAERLYHSLGNPVMAARVRYFRASLMLDLNLGQGNVAAARRDLAQALDDVAGYASAREYVWWLIERAGSLALRHGELEQAARLYAAATAHRDAARRPIEPAERALQERDLDTLRAALGEHKLACCQAEGRVLSLDNAFALARRELEQSKG